MSMFRKTVGYLIVLAIFVVIAAIAALIAPIAFFSGFRDYATRVTRGLSRMAAAFLGKSGRYTTSAECGVAQHGFFARLREVVDFMLGDGHCAGEAKNEGLRPNV